MLILHGATISVTNMIKNTEPFFRMRNYFEKGFLSCVKKYEINSCFFLENSIR